MSQPQQIKALQCFQRAMDKSLLKNQIPNLADTIIESDQLVDLMVGVNDKLEEITMLLYERGAFSNMTLYDDHKGN